MELNCNLVITRPHLDIKILSNPEIMLYVIRHLLYWDTYKWFITRVSFFVLHYANCQVESLLFVTWYDGHLISSYLVYHVSLLPSVCKILRSLRLFPYLKCNRFQLTCVNYVTFRSSSYFNISRYFLNVVSHSLLLFC